MACPSALPSPARSTTLLIILSLALSAATPACSQGGGGHDYAKALQKSLLFFEAQRSGVLPSNQRVTWRANSGLHDGKASGVDLVGGYYDAGDNVKFGLPMAFTVTMMSWSILEYGRQMGRLGELGHALEAVKWGTDYLLKAHPEPEVLYGEVGDGNTDHYCWQRPEEMTTSRAAYRIDANHPGSDLAGETAAAMAAASMVFRGSNPAYAGELLTHAKQLFQFADKYRGKYDASITVAQKYYQSVSGYADELLWAAAWLYQATDDGAYLDYLATNADSLGGTGWAMREFSWDVKYAGVQILASKFLLQGKVSAAQVPTFERYQQKAEYFLCACLGKAGGSGNVQRTPGGLLFRQRWNNLQFVSTASFVLTVYADYLQSAAGGKAAARCAAGPEELVAFAKSQVDYVLGDNPRATSYMVGYGRSWPQQVHHRGASIVSVKVNPAFVTCRGGYDTWFARKASDPNLLDGAIVGGPDAYDNFADERDNYEQTEPATYNNAPIVGVLARLAAGNGGYNQLLPVMIPATAAVAPVATSLNQVPATPSTSSPAAVPPTGGIIAVEQKVTASWESKGKTYYRYSVLLNNNSGKTVGDLRVAITNLYGPVWGLAKTSSADYTFPSWLAELPAGKSLEFVYTQAAPQANVSVSRYTLA